MYPLNSYFLFYSHSWQIVKEKHNDTLIAQLRTALFMAKENIPDRKFGALVDLQLSNGATAFHSESGSAKCGIYTSHHAVSDMQKALASIAKENVIAAAQSSPFIGLMFDESLDVAINKKLVMYCKVLHHGTVKISFCGNVVVQDGKAETIFDTVSNFLNDNNIPMCKVSGLGTDGAAVMMGKKGGVGKRFVDVNPNIVHIWCSAHRLALVSFWAAKNVPALQNVQQVLTEIYNYFHYSAQRYNRIKEMQNVMHSYVKRFKKPSSVRWLSLFDAVSVAHESWSALVLSMEHDANDRDPITSTKAKGFLKKLKSFSFISTLSTLKDILGHLTRASKFFQRDVLDVGQVEMMVLSLKTLFQDLLQADHSPTVQDVLQQISAGNAYCGIELNVSENMKTHAKNLKNTFVRNLVQELETRFEEKTMHVLSHMNTILDPSKLPQSAAGIQTHGRDELQNILDFFDGRLDHSDDARDSFLQYKYLLNVNRNKSVSEFCTLLSKDMHVLFPFYATLAEFFMTVPLTSVPCERGFSNQNRIHTYARNRMNPQTLENKMFLTQASSSPDYDENEFLHLAKNKFKPTK